MQSHPQLQLWQWRQDALAGQHRTSGLRPAVELALEAENFAGSGSLSGTDQAEVTVSLASIIELGGKRDSRLAVSASRQALAAMEQQADSLQLLAQVTQRFIEALALQEKLVLSEQVIRVAQMFLHAVEQRVERGAAPEAESLRAQVALTQAKLSQRALQAELAGRKMLLASLWRAEDVDFDVLVGDLYQFEPAQPFAALYQKAIDSPSIKVFASEARVREAELALARSRASSNVQWHLGVKHLRQTGDNALVAGFSVPLSSGAREQGNIQTAIAQQAMADTRKQSSVLALRASLFDAWQTYQQSTYTAVMLAEQVIPSLEKALTQTRIAYERGRYRYSDLVSVQRELFDTRMAMIDAASNALLNQALIEQLTAAPLAAQPREQVNNTQNFYDSATVAERAH